MDSFKQLKKQFRLLRASFKELLDRKGPLGTLFGFAVRSAIFGLATGIIVGYLQPWREAGIAIKNGICTKIK